MRKFYLFLIVLLSTILVNAQERDAEINQAYRLVMANKTAIGLAADDVNNSKVSDTYISNTSGLRLVYLQQTFNGIPVSKQIQTLAFKNGNLVSKAGERIAGLENLVNVKSGVPAINAESAVMAVLQDKNLSATERATIINSRENGRQIEFTDMGVSHENITAQLVWAPAENGETVKLAWEIYLVSKASSWLVRVDAMNGNILDSDNLTVFDRWDKSIDISNTLNPVERDITFSPLGFKRIVEQENAGQSFIVNGATYRVIPFPAESPIHPGGSHALVTDPWLNAPGNATTLKWHSNGTTDYNITRGNNVWAKEDRAGNNSDAGLPATSTTSPDPLTFNFVPNYNDAQPTQTSPVQNQQFNITNLFYWINLFHDITYLYGFDEPAGNFQANNQGRGGNGNDWVYGDAQDGSGSNNANFSTPPDGSPGRMQMFLFSDVPRLTVNSPAPIAGQYAAVEGAISINNLLANVGPVTGQVVYYNDAAAGNTHYACNPPANNISGKIAMIDRGFGGSVCTAAVPFIVKVKNAQDAGAIAVIMVNNVPGDPITMGGTDNTIIIPAVMISQSDGAIIAAELANNVNVTLAHRVALDGDVDNGIIVHEYAHGLSNRLTGGPGTANCLGNAEQMGEGWSDYYALMFTQNWAGSNLNTGFNSPRGIGCFALGQGPNGSGNRTQKYCTDFNVNNKVYAATISASEHDRGEIWCAILWDMTWNIIQQTGTITSNIYNVNATGGNIIALKLVTEGMKLQPCSPGFVTGRNAILQAEEILFGGQYKCAIWEAFRRRGVGYNASQGSSASITDQIPDFSPFAITIDTQTQDASVCTGTNVTFTVAATGPGATYQWQVSTDGGASYNNISGATSASHTINGVTAGMNNFRYRCVMDATCSPAATSNSALLTVATTTLNITQHPANITVCETANTSFTMTGTGSSLTYQWRVSTDGGASWNNIGGATYATLTLNAVTAVMNNNQYRCLMSNATCTTPAISNAATLTINARPMVTLSAASYTSLLPGLSTTLTATILPSAAGFDISWYRNGTLLPGVNGTTYAADVMKLGDYRVEIVNNLTGCNNQSQLVTIKDSASKKLFIFPNPNSGRFTVAFYNPGGNNTQQTITIYDAKGARVYSKKFSVSVPYQLHDIDLRTASRGVYVVIIGASGTKLAGGKVLIH